MARKRYKPEEIVGKLRQEEVLHGQGMSMADVQGFARNASVPGGSPKLWQDPA